MNINSKNPFQITTPEDLTAEETVFLFVDVFTDFPKIIDPGHVFLTGPRGVGKSMMFRYLQADCQSMVEDCNFSDLPFLGIYIPIKNESFVKTELKRLEDRHASEVFNEHLMVSHMGVKVFDSILKNSKALNCIDRDSLFSYYNEILLPLFYWGNLGRKLNNNDKCNTESILKNIINLMNNAYSIASAYTKKLSFTTDLPIYDGPLFDYQDFFLPIVSEMTNIEGFPKGTVYLLIDDAHFLSEVQTRILNSWIATRTSRKVSLKVSTQYNYKNYYTVTGATIDSPHDYSEIDMATVYTAKSSKSNYKDRIRNIVEKRLEIAGINVPAECFFPEDAKQEEAISKIAMNYKLKYDEGKGRGYYRSDDALRYARPDFIKSLAGPSKSSSSYSYAGFEQLVHLSSGIVRYFLEPAHIMYSKEKSINGNIKITLISPTVQNEIVRNEANKFLFVELEKYKKEGDINAVPKEDIDKLSNLVQGLGGLFRQILLSERSERRVFSIAISDELSESVERILNIGVDFGFFHRSTIGRKNRKSGGRTKLFVMNRRLAPIWTLDPTGFAGYLFIQNKVLEDCINNPQSILSRIEKNEELNDIEVGQLNLFDFSDDTPPIEVFEKEEE